MSIELTADANYSNAIFKITNKITGEVFSGSLWTYLKIQTDVGITDWLGRYMGFENNRAVYLANLLYTWSTLCSRLDDKESNGN